jgi:catechol 2,3-dioxygenase-like lactoylglutathione lyase family enzyme
MGMRALGLDHVVLEVRQPEQALRFYTKVLGLIPERAEAFRAGTVPFVSVRAGSSLIDLFPSEAPGPGPSHLCVEVDLDPEALMAELTAQGVAYVRPGRRFGARGDGFSVYVQDPDGHTVEVRTYAEPSADPRSEGAS